MTQKIELATVRMIHWHSEVGQVRKNFKSTPYWHHPLAVMSIAKWEFGITDEDALVAALLHDVLEDTKAYPSDIVREFGTTVLCYVDCLTRPKQAKGESKAETQVRYLDRLALANNNIKLIKAADCLHNLRDCMGMDKNWAKAFASKTELTINALSANSDFGHLDDVRGALFAMRSHFGIK